MAGHAVATAFSLALAIPGVPACVCLPAGAGNACGEARICACSDDTMSLTWPTVTCERAGGSFRSPRLRRSILRQFQRAVRRGVLTKEVPDAR